MAATEAQKRASKNWRLRHKDRYLLSLIKSEFKQYLILVGEDGREKIQKTLDEVKL